MSRAFFFMIRRDLKLAARNKASLANPLLFFILVTSLFPLGIGANSNLLATAGPGIIWIAALLAALLSIENVFRSDLEDGTLEQYILGPHPVSILALAKIMAHWLTTGLPLLCISPLLGIYLGLPEDGIKVLFLTLLAGTPILSLIGAVGAALTIGLRDGGMILSLLILPLYIPLLIFATSAVDSAVAGLSVTSHLSLITALLALSTSLAPFATAAALRVSVN